jgi:hypothetical protein
MVDKIKNGEKRITFHLTKINIAIKIIFTVEAKIKKLRILTRSF